MLPKEIRRTASQIAGLFVILRGMKRSFGLRRKAVTPYQKAVHKLDAALSVMVRERDSVCITSGRSGIPLDAGHFRRRELMSTRFHPLNVHGQAIKDNRFLGGLTFEYGQALDRKFGKGCAAFLEKLSRAEAKWSPEEMDALTDAAKYGHLVYTQTYYMLRPLHLFTGILTKMAKS